LFTELTTKAANTSAIQCNTTSKFIIQYNGIWPIQTADRQAVKKPEWPQRPQQPKDSEDAEDAATGTG